MGLKKYSIVAFLLLASGLTHSETCDPADPVVGMTAPNVSFDEMIERSRELVGGRAVIGHDSVLCEHSGPVLSPVPTASQRERSALPRVAHAGGGYRGDTYTNSIDALDHNRDDYSLFEIDLLWTSDQRLVCLHDWEQTFEHFFAERTSDPLSLEEFQRLADERSGLEHCTLDSLVSWLENNPRQRIVTDVKEDNITALRRIASRHPELIPRFVPQIYQPEEYFIARDLGYDDVIWTLYRYSGSDDKVLETLPWMDLYGLSMPPERAERGLARRAREQRDVLSWVHTINEPETAQDLFEQGVASIYTDWLPSDGTEDSP